MDSGSTFHPAGVSSRSFEWTACCTLLRTFTEIRDFAVPAVEITATGDSRSTESGGPTASGRSDCPTVGSMNLTFATALTELHPSGVLNCAVTRSGYGGNGSVTYRRSLMV